MLDAAPTSSAQASAGVYPPSFCNWRMVLAIAAMTQLVVFMVGLGRLYSTSLDWLLLVSLYGQSLALLCAMGLCVGRAWLRRTSPRRAWVSCWLCAIILSVSWSYVVGIVSTVLGFGPGREGLVGFMVQSLLGVALVGAALLRYLFIREQWLEEVTAQADARVQALQARIRPHFLFNSLNTIASLIPEHPAAAERATEDLADLFRGSMRRADRVIPLADEVALARKYLDLEQRRLGQRLAAEWRTEELPPDARVPPMILQPLLENAVAHGVQACPDGGLIQVYGRREKDSVVITVSNPLGEPGAERRGEHHGMALRNIGDRLNLAYGERASLITHRDEKQFIVVLTLPYVESADHR